MWRPLYQQAFLRSNPPGILLYKKLWERVLTVTYDRGSEFALWRMIERDTGAKVYFANAHHPWEPGTSENSNGLLRRFFPKGTPIGQRLTKEIDPAIRLINHRPRKCLNWKNFVRYFDIVAFQTRIQVLLRYSPCFFEFHRRHI